MEVAFGELFVGGAAAREATSEGDRETVVFVVEARGEGGLSLLRRVVVYCTRVLALAVVSAVTSVTLEPAVTCAGFTKNTIWRRFVPSLKCDPAVRRENERCGENL